jgi:hypothetical protein
MLGYTKLGHAMVLAAVAWLLSGEAAAHGHGDWYSDLRAPGTNNLCCNDRDCSPVSMCAGSGIGEGVEIEGKCVQVPYDKVLPMSAPDGGAHACWNWVSGKLILRCVILPGLS